MGPDSLLSSLEPLRAEHGRHGDALLLSAAAADIAGVAARFGDVPVTLLVLEPPDGESIRARFPSPFLDRGGRTLLGWLRQDGRELAAYAGRAAAVMQRRSQATLPVALLASRERRYLQLLTALERVAARSACRAFNWSAERLRPTPLARALQCGVGAVLHASHGAPAGWYAYGGLSARRLSMETTWTHHQTAALLFSLACHTGLPMARDQRGFADELVARGVAGTVLAPVGEPFHADNRRLARGLMQALAGGARHLADVLGYAWRCGGSLGGYSVIGDPGLPAAATEQSLVQAQSVLALAPDALVVRDTTTSPSPGADSPS